MLIIHEDMLTETKGMIDFVREQTNLRFLYGVIHADVALVSWVFSIQGCLYEVYDLVRHTINNKTDLFIKQLTSLIPHKSQKLTKNGFKESRF